MDSKKGCDIHARYSKGCSECSRQPTRDEKCADLARAMGYTAMRIAGVPPGFVAWIAPDGRRLNGGHVYDSAEQAFAECAPAPFTDHDACHALVCWLSEDEARWKRFEDIFLARFSDEPDIVRECLLADPAVIAEAAWRAITTTP